VPVLSELTVDGLVGLAGRLRPEGARVACMEDLADATVRFLYRELTDADGEPACALVRFYVTQRLADLEPALRDYALLGASHVTGLDEATRCFTLLATVGHEPAWCDRRASEGHQAIALVDEESVEAMPMLAGLLTGLGVGIAEAVQPPEDASLGRHQRRYDVFHVADAATSPYVPAKDFVRRYGICSAVGLGGVIPSGELFCVLLFSRVPIDDGVADLLGSLAVTIKAGVTPYTFRVFPDAPASP
jgi:hypothetical protein